MSGYFAPVLHAHLPFVRHPEHEHFLEENWLFEAVAECYLPLIRVMEGWLADGIDARLTLTLTPTLCAMLRDPLLQDRCERYLRGRVELAGKEICRTHWDNSLRPLAEFYRERFEKTLESYLALDRDLVRAFKQFQELGRIEIITSSATHALLPLLQGSPESLRAQVLVARDDYRTCFGRDPRGIWLPECAYDEAVEPALQEAGIRWFLVETHGILHARPRPRYGTFAPVYTPNGLAAFGRDYESARQVWSRDGGYPGDPCYRDFYRDIGFDLDLDYIRPHLPAPPHRSFTGVKYWAITGCEPKRAYDRAAALERAAAHAQHFLDARVRQIQQTSAAMDRPPILVAPYDAELFGHWWYEGPEFLDFFFRKAALDPSSFRLTTPGEYLREHPTQQAATPGASSWGEEGYWKVWLNETNEWMHRHLQIAQERMRDLVRRHPRAEGLAARALRQAAREILLAQSSDWPFILRTGTSPDYARQRFQSHLLRFHALHEQLTSTRVDEIWLAEVEARDNLLPEVNWRYWE